MAAHLVVEIVEKNAAIGQARQIVAQGKAPQRLVRLAQAQVFLEQHAVEMLNPHDERHAERQHGQQRGPGQAALSPALHRQLHLPLRQHKGSPGERGHQRHAQGGLPAVPVQRGNRRQPDQGEDEQNAQLGEQRKKQQLQPGVEQQIERGWKADWAVLRRGVKHPVQDGQIHRRAQQGVGQRGAPRQQTQRGVGQQQQRIEHIAGDGEGEQGGLRQGLLVLHGSAQGHVRQGARRARRRRPAGAR